MEIKTAYISGHLDAQNRVSSSSTARSARMLEPYVQPPSVFEFTLPLQEKKRPFWSFGSTKDLGSTNVTEREVRTENVTRPSTASRKLTLVYDPDFPADPPKFHSYDRETNDFSGFDGDFSGNIAGAEEGMEGRKERGNNGIQRETIGAAI